MRREPGEWPYRVRLRRGRVLPTFSEGITKCRLVDHFDQLNFRHVFRIGGYQPIPPRKNGDYCGRRGSSGNDQALPRRYHEVAASFSGRQPMCLHGRRPTVPRLDGGPPVWAKFSYWLLIPRRAAFGCGRGHAPHEEGELSRRKPGGEQQSLLELCPTSSREFHSPHTTLDRTNHLPCVKFFSILLRKSNGDDILYR